MKTSELIGPALDWAVAKGEGWKYDDTKKILEFKKQQISSAKHCYSTVWAKGGPIIEREWISIWQVGKNYWKSDIGGLFNCNGPTPLVAAMRCFVASKLGDEIEIPKEFL